MIKDYILKKYEELKTKPIYVNKKDLYYYEEEEDFSFEPKVDNQSIRFLNATECLDYLEDKSNNIFVKVYQSEYYYLKQIEDGLVDTIDILSKEEVDTIIKCYLEDYNGKFVNSYILDILNQTNNILDEFYNNTTFSHIIMQHYILSVLYEKQKQDIIQETIDRIIYQEYINGTAQSIHRLKRILKSNNPEIKDIFCDLILNSDELNNNSEYQFNFLPFLTKEQIEVFFRIDDYTTDKIMKLYVEGKIKEYDKNLQVETITQIARYTIQEFYDYVRKNNSFEASIDLVGSYLISDSKINISKHKSMFLEYSSLESRVKRIAISLLLMEYALNVKTSLNKKKIADNDLKTLFKSFYQDDEFRNSLISKYFKIDSHLEYNVNKVDQKFKILARIDQL